MAGINFSASNTPSANMPSGVQMGNMGEGGGSNFYMGGDEQPQDENQKKQKEKDYGGNPDLVFIDQAKENENNQNRQYLEELVTGGRRWFNPWETPPEKRSKSTREAERQEMMTFSFGNPDKKMFIINA